MSGGRRLACEDRHPGIPSEIFLYEAEGKTRRRCKVCARIRALEGYHRYREKHQKALSYDLLPRLTWPAPEFQLTK